MASVYPLKLRAGEVIEWDDGLALVASNEYPAGSVSLPEGGRYTEPCLIILAHQQGDRWVHTHMMTYALLRITKPVKVREDVRIQRANRVGPFLGRAQRLVLDWTTGWPRHDDQ